MSRLLHRLKLKTVLWTLGLTIVFWGLHSLGIFQWGELLLFDHLVRHRPPVPLDSHITIVGITEADLRNQGIWPISDAALAKALTLLESHHPRVVALDFYRDLPVFQGRSALTSLFQTTPNILGSEKRLGVTISPPPGISPDRTGFVDFVLDPDNVLRRALLAVQGRQSLASLAALKYLQGEHISLEPLPQRTDQSLRLGKAIVHRLQSNSGAYSQIDTEGYQLLINYRGPSCALNPSTCKTFRMYSFSDLLADRIPARMIEDQLVFIGALAPSLQDIFKTPYTTSGENLISGVEIHAQIASELIDAALGDRPLFRFWPEWFELMWLLVWTATTVELGFGFFHHRWALFIIVPLLLLALVIMVIALIGWGYWVPAILPGISIVLSSFLVQWRVLWTNLKQSYATLTSYANTLEAQVTERTQTLLQEIEQHKTTAAALQRANQKLRSLALLDGLTQVANRRRLDEYLEEMWERSLEQQRWLGIVICDIDHFKAYNDTYGHQAGDSCIQTIAKILRESVTSPQLVARYGGEEFVLILPYADLSSVIRLVETIQQQLRQAQLVHCASDTAPYVTLSLGITGMVPTLDLSPPDLLAYADQALYAAKTTGRDRFAICIPTPQNSADVSI